MTSQEIREKFLKFFEDKKHVRITPARLVLDNDPTTLFTSSGMQPLIPYLLGETHPSGVRLVDSQPCFRAEDIDEVGDNRHTTFFEMLGNWSLGDYFKKEEIPWLWEFLTKELNLPKEKLHVTIFEGNEIIPKDEESLEIWKGLGVSNDHIHFYGAEKNWWSRSGPLDSMPVGELGGPDTEVFYEFIQVEHDKKFGENCHPNCDCGRFMEIANGVFVQYKKTGDGEFEKLNQQNVDFGGGLERLSAASNDDPDIFNIDLIKPVIKAAKILDRPTEPNDRIVADHFRAAVFLILDGVIPSNKLHGYVLRRLLRRSLARLNDRLEGFPVVDQHIHEICEAVLDIYNGLHEIDKARDLSKVIKVVDDELAKFGNSLNNGLIRIEQAIKNGEETDSKFVFDLYQSYGFPFELIQEEFKKRDLPIPKRREFVIQYNIHKQLSRSASAGMFKGGLAGHSEVETKYHTATHLLHQALRDVLGSEVFQKGSNITTERLRFDFSFDRKPTEEELKKVEDLVNEKIKEDLKVDRKFMTADEAYELNAIGLFNDKYAKEVSIYCIGLDSKLDPDTNDQRKRGGYYSLEFCGGPHVEHTGVIGEIKITKEESVSQGVRRIYAELA